MLISTILLFGLAIGPMFFFSERLGLHIGMGAGSIGTVLSAATFMGLMGALLAGRAAEWLPAQGHFGVESQQAWLKLGDDLPRHEYPDTFIEDAAAGNSATYAAIPKISK